MAKSKVTVIRREYFTDLAEKYLNNPKVGACPLFKDGQEFIFNWNAFWHMPQGFCSKAWGAISHYVFAQISGGVVLKGWTNDGKLMIGCCSDGVRPVIFKIERMDD